MQGFMLSILMFYISLRDFRICKAAEIVPLSLLLFACTNLIVFTSKLYLAIKKFYNPQIVKTNFETIFLIVGWFLLVLSFLNCVLQYVLVHRRIPKTLPIECLSFWFIFWYLLLTLAIFMFAALLFTLYYYFKSKRQHVNY
jgi:hypothetical protein